MAYYKTWLPPELVEYLLSVYWRAIHAAVTHEGSPDRNILPRRWTDHAISENDLIGIFEDAYRQSKGDLEQAWKLFAETMDREFKKQITSVRYRWHGITVRKSGAIVGSPRDIVDTEELLNSQEWILEKR